MSSRRQGPHGCGCAKGRGWSRQQAGGLPDGQVHLVDEWSRVKAKREGGSNEDHVNNAIWTGSVA